MKTEPVKEEEEKKTQKREETQNMKTEPVKEEEKRKEKKKKPRTDRTSERRRRRRKKKKNQTANPGEGAAEYCLWVPYVCLITILPLSYELWKLKTAKICFQFP